MQRKELNEKLSALPSNSSGQYYIIVGPRGAGKSIAVEQACKGKPGVAGIRVDQTNDNVFELVADAFGINSPAYSFKRQYDLVKLFRKASEKMGVDWVPTIVAEVDGPEPGTLQNVCKALKVFFVKLAHRFRCESSKGYHCIKRC